jgi:very-short-patch-repair endonuclease
VGVPALIARHPRRRGSANLRAVLADATLGDDVPQTRLEAAFLLFVEERALPRPVGHPAILDYEPDYAWPAQRLIVELDGRATHRTTSRFESDRTRDRRLALDGWTVIRITWRMLHAEREALATDLLALLAR